MAADFPLSDIERLLRSPWGGRRIAHPRIDVIDLPRQPAIQRQLRVAQARAHLLRLVSRSPQVMVKVSGRQKGLDHVKAHFLYIARHGKLDLLTEDGTSLTERSELGSHAQDWCDGDDSLRANATTAISMVLSMPAGTDEKALLAAAQAFAHIEFGERHRYVLAQHSDTEHPHVHLTVAVAGADGQRFNPRKADLFRMREVFAHELRERGVDADASSRRLRGVVRRADNLRLHKVKERLSARGLVARSILLADQAGAAFVLRQQPLRPWEAHVLLRQRAVRQAYLGIARKLARSDDGDDRGLASRLAAFIREMPKPLSRRLQHAARHVVDRRDGRDSARPSRSRER